MLYVNSSLIKLGGKIEHPRAVGQHNWSSIQYVYNWNPRRDNGSEEIFEKIT